MFARLDGMRTNNGANVASLQQGYLAGTIIEDASASSQILKRDSGAFSAPEQMMNGNASSRQPDFAAAYMFPRPVLRHIVTTNGNHRDPTARLSMTLIGVSGHDTSEFFIEGADR